MLALGESVSANRQDESGWIGGNFERSRWRAAVKRERELQRERIELSQTIHDTAAQTAFMIGLGIDAARRVAGDSNDELDFGRDELRLSVSDDGAGLPDDYEERGHGFANMRAYAEHLGGRLAVDPRGALGARASPA